MTSNTGKQPGQPIGRIMQMFGFGERHTPFWLFLVCAAASVMLISLSVYTFLDVSAIPRRYQTLALYAAVAEFVCGVMFMVVYFVIDSANAIISTLAGTAQIWTEHLRSHPVSRVFDAENIALATSPDVAARSLDL